MPKFNHEDLEAVLNVIYRKGIITAVDSGNDTADVDVPGGQSGSGVPIYYHCEPDSELRDNGAIYGAASGFSAGTEEDPEDGDEVIVMCDTEGAPLRIIGFVDGIRSCCLYKNLCNGGYTWEIEGIVSDAFLDGVPGLNRTGSVTTLSMDDDGVIICNQPSSGDGQSYQSHAVCRVKEITEASKILIPINGPELWFTQKVKSMHGEFLCSSEVVYSQIQTNFCGFIEVLNNRGHYMRIYNASYSKMIRTTPSGSTTTTWYLGGACHFKAPNTTYDMTEPFVIYSNIMGPMFHGFLDIERYLNPETGKYDYYAINDASFWIVGAGVAIEIYNVNETYKGDITVDFDEFSICKNKPDPYDGYEDRVLDITGAFIPDHFYNVPGPYHDIKYPWKTHWYTTEEYIP